MFDILEKPVIARNTYRKKIGNITAEHDYFKKLQHYQYFNNDLQHISNKDIKQKLNVSKEVLSTKESSEDYQRIHQKIPALFQHQSQMRFLIHFHV